VVFGGRTGEPGSGMPRQPLLQRDVQRKSKQCNSLISNQLFRHKRILARFSKKPRWIKRCL
jgi:hypothetical protein